MMLPSKIESHIDNRIISYFNENLTINEVINNINNNIISFKKRDSFINVKKRYLLNNWNLIAYKKKYTTFCVMHYSKRVTDLKWLIKNQYKFEKAPYCIYKSTNLFNLILLKDKLSLKLDPIKSFIPKTLETDKLVAHGFSVGKWYLHGETYLKFLKIESNTMYCVASEIIIGKIYSKTTSFFKIGNIIDVNLDDIRMLLPEGHIDKIKSDSFLINIHW